MQIAVCPGSFDPITNGHIDVIERAAAIFDKVVVGIAENSHKKSLFSLEERVKFVCEATAHLKNVTVKSFNCLLVEFAREHQARIIIRGLRAVSDFEHEFQMAQLNHELDPSI
ncbi:MAG: pantetheine-phosphate adenylyltransferase, partial [Candidatus Subteraquimicrobiales bacterium]|nr:pantetheine-phosphate adenylyltransferase [Candidatus Subteraquimicrobiales bacterium]